MVDPTGASMNPHLRRILFAVTFETFGLILSTTFMMAATGAGVSEAGSLSVAAGLIALGWNYGFNWLFEIWEDRRPTRGRPIGRRILHGVLFEVSLTVIMLPLLMWWLATNIWTALAAEVGLVAAWGIYTIAYTWAFDRIFGLPASAR
jgi:uncharacterized membrane protein